MWHDTFICVTWYIHICYFRSTLVGICVTWLIQTCDVTHSYIQTLLKIGMLTCDMAHSYFSPNTFIYTVSSQRWLYGSACSTLVYVFLMWRIDWCDKIESHVEDEYDFIDVLAVHTNESRHTIKWVTSHTWSSHVTYMNETRPIHECTGFTYIMDVLGPLNAFVWCGTFICLTWFIHMCKMTSMSYMYWPRTTPVFVFVTWCIRMGWLRLVGSIKL